MQRTEMGWFSTVESKHRRIPSINQASTPQQQNFTTPIHLAKKSPVHSASEKSKSSEVRKSRLLWPVGSVALRKHPPPLKSMRLAPPKQQEPPPAPLLLRQPTPRGRAWGQAHTVSSHAGLWFRRRWLRLVLVEPCTPPL